MKAKKSLKTINILKNISYQLNYWRVQSKFQLNQILINNIEEAGYYWYFKIFVAKDPANPHETLLRKIEQDLAKNAPK